MNSETRQESSGHVEYLIKLECKTNTPLHVGGGDSSEMTDSDLRRNSKGQIVIPGTSIAGVMRTAIEKLAKVQSGGNACHLYQSGKHSTPCKCVVCIFMGNATPVGAEPWVTQSKVTFDDVIVTAAQERIVDAVAIERTRRTTSDAKKFDHAQILPGANLEIVIRSGQLSDKELNWLESAARMLAEGTIRIGAKTNRGLGRLEPADDGKGCAIFRRDLGSIDALIALAIGSKSDSNGWTVIKSGLTTFLVEENSTNQISFTLETDASSGLLVADPIQSVKTGFDRAQRKLNNLPELPVTSLIGAIRSGCERIVRTVVPEAGCNLLSGTDTGKTKVCKCIVCHVFGNTEWASRISAGVDTTESGYDLPMDHVAIDRFTGGASDRKKFDAKICRDAKFKVTLTFNSCVNSDEAKWMAGLLVLAIRDLNDGIIRLGSGRSKGYGKMNVADDKLNWSGEEFEAHSKNLQQCVDSLWQKVELQNSKSEVAVP